MEGGARDLQVATRLRSTSNGYQYSAVSDHASREQLEKTIKQFLLRINATGNNNVLCEINFSPAGSSTYASLSTNAAELRSVRAARVS